jgi:hypothetical protein
MILTLVRHPRPQSSVRMWSLCISFMDKERRVSISPAVAEIEMKSNDMVSIFFK